MILPKCPRCRGGLVAEWRVDPPELHCVACGYGRELTQEEIEALRKGGP